MKRFSGKWLNAVALVVVLCLLASLAMADGNDYRVKKVETNSGNINEFASAAPAVTIRINYDQLHDSNNMDVWYQTGYGFSTGKGNSPKDDGSGDFILYSPNQDTKTGSLWPTDSSGSRTINIKSSTNEPLFKFTFRDAAELANGETADVVVSYDNLTFYLRNSVDNGNNYVPRMKDFTYYIASGILFRTGTTSGDSNYRYGITTDAHIDIRKKDGTPITEITTKDDSNPEPATFFYTVTDIDVWRPSHENFGKQLTSGELHNYFSEQVTINEESIYEKSDIYIPWQTDRNPQHLDHWERKQDTSEITFSPFMNYNDPETYYSGFATVINNARGLDLTITSSGSGGATVRTYLYDRPKDQGKYIQHRIESESGRGGDIFTTEFGDPDKKVYDHKKGTPSLDSKDRLFDEGVYIFPDGKDVAYTMIPNEPGSTIREIEIYGDIKGNLTSNENVPKIRFSKEVLKNIPIGGKYTGVISLRDNRTGTLERLADGVSYRFTFNNNNHDHYIKVTWEKLISIPVQKEWEDEGNHFQNRPTQIVMNVFRNGEQYLCAQVLATENWSYKFTDIPAWDENEADYVYTVQESHVEGYQEGEVKRNDESGFTVTNRLETTNITVKKRWQDDTASDRPEYITVSLMDGNVQISSMELNSSNNWEGTFSGLPTYRAGKKCSYTVTEEKVDGYHPEITPRDDHGTILITNRKLNSTIPTIHLRVQKNLNGLGAAGFTFQLKDPKTGNVLDTVATDSNGEATLDLNLTEAKVATYRFEIDEHPDKLTPKTVTYDLHHVDVTVEVKSVINDDGKAVLQPTVTYSKNGTVIPEGMAIFNNTFKVENTGTIKVFKQLTGRKWTQDDSFRFKLTPVSGAPLRTATRPNGTDALYASTQLNEAEDRHVATFENLVFNQDDLINDSQTAFVQEKIFKYRIDEVIPEGADSFHMLNGVTYTDVPQYIQVKIRNDRINGKLDVTYILDGQEVYTPTGPTFVNHYSYRPADVTLMATKMILGHKGQLLDNWIEEYRKAGSTELHDWSGTSFSFVLTPQSGEYGKTEIKTATKNDPKVTFSPIIIRKPGRYIFMISEQLPEVEDDTETPTDNPNTPIRNGLLYDTSAHRIEVDVVDNGKGQLEYTVKYPNANRQTLSPDQLDKIKDITNLIIFNRAAPDAYFNIHAKKKIVGAPYISGQFIFRLDEDDQGTAGRNHEGYNGPDGIVSFDMLTYEHDDLFGSGTSDAGEIRTKTLHYVMEEKNDKIPGWEYDGHKIKFQVTISHATDHKIHIDGIQYSLDNGSTWTDYKEDELSTYPVFTNTYTSEGSASFHVDKRISGRDWAEDDQFEFVLMGIDGAPIHIKNSSGDLQTLTELKTTASYENRNPSFERLWFTNEDLKDSDGNYVTEKTFRYRIHETAAGDVTDGSYTHNGMTYAADQVFEIHVHNDDFDAELDITFNKGTHTLILDPFINHYQVGAVQEVRIEAYKQISGRAWRSGDSFTFRIIPMLNDAGYAKEEMPMPESRTMDITWQSPAVKDAANTRSGKFGKITFTKPGYYEYDLEEVTPAVIPHGFTYTLATRRVLVVIRDRGDGLLAEPEIHYPSTDSDKPTTFVNTWKADPDDSGDNDFHFYFTKVWVGPVRDDVKFTLYNADGTERRHTLRRVKISDHEYRYECWLSTGGDYYAVEKPLDGYTASYQNAFPHGDVTDRAYYGGVITNRSTPLTGDQDNPLVWALLIVGGLAVIGLLIVYKKKKRS